MKKFATVTEYEVLSMAHSVLLDRYLTAEKRARELPENQIAQARFEKARARYEEINAELLRLEKLEDSNKR